MFIAAVLQVSVFTSLQLGEGNPDLLLVTLAMVALLRGPIYGACAGFFGGLIVDTATLATLGVASLLLIGVGYWIGRYGETTGRDRRHAPLLSVLVITVLYAVAALALHFMLGNGTAARLVLLEALPPTLVLNLLLTPPVYVLARALLRPVAVRDRAAEVRLLG